MSESYLRGAEWRKWDLHFHTPSSYDYKNCSVTNNDIIDALEEKNISLVAITDHHIIDIERISLLNALAKPKGITILPGIEFLSDSRGSEPVHFIGIFAEDCNIEYVWGQIQNLTAIKGITGASKKENEVYCHLIETTNLIHELGGIVSVHAGKKYGTVENITNSLPHAQAQKTDIAHNVDIFELGKEQDQEGYRSVVFLAIDKTVPMIMCSDNHNAKEYQHKTNCWVKADPSFDGLRQLVNEPIERVYIGSKPPLFDRVASKRTKFIKELSISKNEDYKSNHGVWFDDIKIPINQELVAIIGNKGSGKSAVADIISLCSNYHNDKDFSFLTTSKFKEKSGRISKNFNATLTWESGKQETRNLNETPESTELISVKYLPQGRFELLTNEINSPDGFQQEIESVVFSHIPESERLSTKTFKELIEKKSSTVDVEIESLKDEVEELNKKIIQLEAKSDPKYRVEIQNKVKSKQEEIEALIKPKEVSNPNEDPEKKKQSEEVTKKIDEIKAKITELEDQSIKATAKKTNLYTDQQTLETIRGEINQKVSEITRYKTEKAATLAEFSIDIDTVFTFCTDFSELDKLINEKKQEINKINILLGEESSETDSIPIPQKIEALNKGLQEETNKLNVEQRQYQDYLNAKTIWEKEVASVTGDVDQPDTLKYYEEELKYIDNTLKNELTKEYENRISKTKTIFEKKQEVISVYKDIRKKLNDIIKSNAETMKSYKILVDASLVLKSDFVESFLSFILQNKAGTFHSKDGGEAEIKALASDIDFDKEDDVVKFLNGIILALKEDHRINQRNEMRIVSEQVKDNLSFYNYLFSLGFLDNNYQLKQGDKTLEQLSPGERGALLLVFYLLLDNSDIPLIIDQPEDNLDNHSVATVLVPFIRAAKKNRQIIMVTHNPNLAVVADAEQIIYVEIDKENNYKFLTVNGSIESKVINEKIVEVLEGAMPAFNTRKKKYYD